MASNHFSGSAGHIFGFWPVLAGPFTNLPIWGVQRVKDLSQQKMEHVCYLLEMESRTQRSRPSTQEKSEAKAKDRLFENRPSQCQVQEWSRSRTKNTTFLKIMVGKFSIIFQCESV